MAMGVLLQPFAPLDEQHKSPCQIQGDAGWSPARFMIMTLLVFPLGIFIYTKTCKVY